MKPFKFFSKINYDEIIWKTSTGRHTPIMWMSTTHIKNVLKCLRGEGGAEIPNPYFGRTHSEWFEIFDSVLITRNLY